MVSNVFIQIFLRTGDFIKTKTEGFVKFIVQMKQLMASVHLMKCLASKTSDFQSMKSNLPTVGIIFSK